MLEDRSRSPLVYKLFELDDIRVILLNRISQRDAISLLSVSGPMFSHSIDRVYGTWRYRDEDTTRTQCVESEIVNFNVHDKFMRIRAYTLAVKVVCDIPQSLLPRAAGELFRQFPNAFSLRSSGRPIKSIDKIWTFVHEAQTPKPQPTILITFESHLTISLQDNVLKSCWKHREEFEVPSDWANCRIDRRVVITIENARGATCLKNVPGIDDWAIEMVNLLTPTMPTINTISFEFPFSCIEILECLRFLKSRGHEAPAEIIITSVDPELTDLLSFLGDRLIHFQATQPADVNGVSSIRLRRRSGHEGYNNKKVQEESWQMLQNRARESLDNIVKDIQWSGLPKLQSLTITCIFRRSFSDTAIYTPFKLIDAKQFEFYRPDFPDINTFDDMFRNALRHPAVQRRPSVLQIEMKPQVLRYPPVKVEDTEG